MESQQNWQWQWQQQWVNQATQIDAHLSLSTPSGQLSQLNRTAPMFLLLPLIGQARKKGKREKRKRMESRQSRQFAHHYYLILF